MCSDGSILMGLRPHDPPELFGLSLNYADLSVLVIQRIDFLRIFAPH